MKVLVCDDCNGTGEVTCMHCNGSGLVDETNCPNCAGDKVESCNTCWGSGDLEPSYDEEENERKPRRKDGWS
ncbi:MAG: hypothetical protein HQL69_11390 [Magnetococcales bacterium]|nr:hypothetical protein [Magnetococcales bacterium]